MNILKKKGQAALEFLTTYGWAFMVILVMIGALAYFGVLNPRSMVPDKCTVTAGFICEDYLIDTTNDVVQIALTNNMGKTITLAAGSITADYSGDEIIGSTAIICSHTGIGTTDSFATGADIDYSCSVAGSTIAALQVGDKANINFDVTYTIVGGGGFSHTVSGSISAGAQ